MQLDPQPLAREIAKIFKSEGTSAARDWFVHARYVRGDRNGADILLLFGKQNWVDELVAKGVPMQQAYMIIPSPKAGRDFRTACDEYKEKLADDIFWNW